MDEWMTTAFEPSFRQIAEEAFSRRSGETNLSIAPAVMLVTTGRRCGIFLAKGFKGPAFWRAWNPLVR
jgi:hypothetical protein